MKLFLLLCGVIFVSYTVTSCGTKIDMTQKIKYQTKIDSLTITALDPVIQKNDLLYINFSVIGSKEAQEVMELYNGRNTSLSSASTSGYLVSPKGNITITSVGEMPVAGKTKTQVIEELQEKMRKYINKTVVVTLRIINYTVYIEGEVGNPGAINVQNELITLQEAIAVAKGTTPFAVLSDVEIIRKENGVTKIVHIDLRGEEIYTTKSDFYYLKQGDMIQIKADKEKYLASNSSNSRIVSYATATLSLLLTLFTVLKN